MAWTAPITWTNSVLTAAQLNAQVRDNMNETAPAKASTEGQYFVATGANGITPRIASQDNIDTIQTTTSTTFTDLATVGPDFNVTHGTRCLVGIYSYVSNNTNSQGTVCSFDFSPVTGGHTLGPGDSRSLYVATPNAPVAVVASAVFLATAMTTGTSLLRMKYRVTGGTGTYDHRRIWAVPF